MVKPLLFIFTEKNEFGQFLVNYTQEDVTCVIELPENQKFTLRESESEVVSGLSGKCEIMVKKLSAVLIEKEEEAIRLSDKFNNTTLESYGKTLYIQSSLENENCISILLTKKKPE